MTILYGKEKKFQNWINDIKSEEIDGSVDNEVDNFFELYKELDSKSNRELFKSKLVKELNTHE